VQPDPSSVQPISDPTALVLDIAQEAFVSTDPGRDHGWNAAAERTFGWSRAEVLGRPLQETIIPPASPEAHRSGLGHHLATGVRAQTCSRSR